MTEAKIEIIEADWKEAYRYFGVKATNLARVVSARCGITTVGVASLWYYEGEIWGFIDIKPRYVTRMFYRKAKLFLEQCANMGIKRIKVMREDVPTSTAFLTKLGFEKTEEIKEDKEVWLWQQ